MLKAEFRNMERSKKREGVDMTYLKNVILKLLETGILKKGKSPFCWSFFVLFWWGFFIDY